jgi:hypothetical protein
MGALSRLRRWLNRGDTGSQSTTGADTTDPEGDAGSDSGDPPNGEPTGIEDAAATSLRAIKLPDSEREALDAENRER